LAPTHFRHHNGSDFNKAVLDVCVVAFWGLAHLADLMYVVKEGSILASDVVFTLRKNMGNVVTLTIRNTKTAAPGEPQIITLCKLNHVLCLVLAVKWRLSEMM
jgi:hypothetical protein